MAIFCLYLHPQYMDPEELRGSQITTLTSIYAVEKIVAEKFKSVKGRQIGRRRKQRKRVNYTLEDSLAEMNPKKVLYSTSK